jgi:hypothetical protein
MKMKKWKVLERSASAWLNKTMYKRYYDECWAQVLLVKPNARMKISCNGGLHHIMELSKHASIKAIDTPRRKEYLPIAYCRFLWPDGLPGSQEFAVLWFHLDMLD